METATKAMIEAPSFDNMREVQSVLYREYMDEIESLANGALEEAKEGGVFGSNLPERFRELLEESIDSHNWIIYNNKARLVLWVSDNEGAYENEIGEEGASDNVKAYFAMVQDAMDWADRNNLLDSEEDEEEEEAEEETEQ